MNMIERYFLKVEPPFSFAQDRPQPGEHSSTSLRAGSATQRVITVFLCVFVSLCFKISNAQRTDILLNDNWETIADDQNKNSFAGFEQLSFNDKSWKKVDIPHNWDQYEGYRRLRHGNRHGYAWYRKTFSIKKQPAGKRFFLFFEGVGSYATVWLNGKQVGYHAGGRTSFTLDVTNVIRPDQSNILAVRADHPANIKDLPWVCGGCSDERGFSEGSQPMGIFRPVHLVITNDVRIEPFGVHAWANIEAEKKATLYVKVTVKNYSEKRRDIFVSHQLIDKNGRYFSQPGSWIHLQPLDSVIIATDPIVVNKPELWSVEQPDLYMVRSLIMENNKIIDSLTTPFGFRTINWKNPSHQFMLNGKPVFINGVAEYEHLLGQSHAFSDEQVRARMRWVQAAGFNAFRDGHQPHNLRYGQLCNQKGILWWTQMSAHIWYDTPEFRKNFKQLLKEWVIERRNDPSVILWGLQNESKLPKDFAEECTALIRSLDPTASTQRLVTTCNGGEGTDWDVPQNWTGTYGGDPNTYGNDLKKQILVGEYGAWRTIDLHTEGGFVQNGALSEDRMTRLMEQKIRLAESVKDSVAGHFFWLLTSHDNPGRVQGGEGYRELDRIGPVNYKGLLTPWEEPTDAFYMFRSNYAGNRKEPMVYIVSHTWPDRWTDPGKKDGIIVYSNCEEVELFNDVRSVSLGRKKRRPGAGVHFQWDGVDINYNVLYAVGYVNGREVARDFIVLHHLPQSPQFNKFYEGEKNITAPEAGYSYLYRVNCGGPSLTDVNGNTWMADRQKNNSNTWGSASWTSGFAGMPPYFASQRKINDPIKGSRDWELFQSFRYGREKLKYDFPVQDGEYLVEFYFTEPWLGRGGMNAEGLRLFDVAINGNTVLKNVDLWKEDGLNVVVKKSFVVKVKGGNLEISFPNVAVGQAVISAIAIASKKGGQIAEMAPDLLTLDSVGNYHKNMHWLSTGDKVYIPQREQRPVYFSALPPELYGAQWLKGTYYLGVDGMVQVVEDADVFIAIDSTKLNPKWLNGFGLMTNLITISNGRSFKVYKKKMLKGERFSIDSLEDGFVLAQPASMMEPAYDLKPVSSYKAINANWKGSGMMKGQLDGKDRVIFNKASKDNEIEWSFSTGVADNYSLTISYNNPKQQVMKGQLQLLSANGTVMKEESVEFTPTRPGKSNYINTTTGTMINAGNYKLKLRSGEAEGLSINSLDVQ